MALTLLGEWGFLDNLNDTSGNGRHGTFDQGGAGGSLTYVDGPQAGTRAVQFGAGEHTISLGRTGLEPMLDGVTTMGWMRLESVGDALFGLLTKARGTFSSRHRTGAIVSSGTKTGTYAARWKDDLHFADQGAVNDTNWHHYALVDGNTRWDWYVDGVQLAGGARGFDNSTVPTWENYPWRIGRNSELDDQWADDGMSVTGVRIFQGEATAADVQAWMNRSIMATSRDFFSLMR